MLVIIIVPTISGFVVIALLIISPTTITCVSALPRTSHIQVVWLRITVILVRGSPVLVLCGWGCSLCAILLLLLLLSKSTICRFMPRLPTIEAFLQWQIQIWRTFQWVLTGTSTSLVLVVRCLHPFVPFVLGGVLNFCRLRPEPLDNFRIIFV